MLCRRWQTFCSDENRENALTLFIPQKANVHRVPSLLTVMVNEYIKSHTF